MIAGVSWVGGRAYARCEDCNTLVQLNKRFLGSLHICLTACEKGQRETGNPGFHWDAKARRRGPFWARRTETWCGVCGQVVA